MRWFAIDPPSPRGPSSRALKLEDPRLTMLMTAPLVRKNAGPDRQRFHYVAPPRVGEVLLWDSWLRHEVPMNMSEEVLISVSFSYGWA
jgi:uncharacterized protein (TIGR02466 family)